jgi:hypothetical protein
MSQKLGEESEIYFKWDEVIPRMKKELSSQEDKNLREFLDLGSSNFSNYKNAKRVPQKWIFKFATKRGIPFERIVRPDIVDVPETSIQRAPSDTVKVSAPQLPPRSGEFPPQYERRRWLKLRQVINDLCVVDGVRGAIGDILELGLPNLTPILLREAHRRSLLLL